MKLTGLKQGRVPVQGFFEKQASMAEPEKTVSVIMEYWTRCAAPNRY